MMLAIARTGEGADRDGRVAKLGGGRGQLLDGDRRAHDASAQGAFRPLDRGGQLDFAFLGQYRRIIEMSEVAALRTLVLSLLLDAMDGRSGRFGGIIERLELALCLLHLRAGARRTARTASAVS
jgi:hypothetical protein